MSKSLSNTNKSPWLFMHESVNVDQSASSVTPKRASSTSAIWWFDKAHLSVGLAGGATWERLRSVVGWRMDRQAGQPHMLRNVQPGAGRGRGRRGGRPGTASAHRHAARTHPRRRHDARARGASLRLIAAIFKRAQCTPPATRYEFHSRTLLLRWPSTTDRTDPFIICDASAVHRLAACFKVVLITSWTGDSHAR